MPIEELQNLSLSDLLSGPLVAAIDASLHAQTETVALLREVGYDRQGSLRTVSFDYETSDLDPETGEQRRGRRRLEIPLLLFLSLPNLQVSEIEEQFSARITRVESVEREIESSGAFLPSRLTVTPAERSTTMDRKTRSRFHLDVRMVAELQNQTPGMEVLERAANAAVTERDVTTEHRPHGKDREVADGGGIGAKPSSGIDERTLPRFEHRATIESDRTRRERADEPDA